MPKIPNMRASEITCHQPDWISRSIARDYYVSLIIEDTVSQFPLSTDLPWRGYISRDSLHLPLVMIKPNTGLINENSNRPYTATFTQYRVCRSSLWKAFSTESNNKITATSCEAKFPISDQIWLKRDPLEVSSNRSRSIVAAQTRVERQGAFVVYGVLVHYARSSMPSSLCGSLLTAAAAAAARDGYWLLMERGTKVSGRYRNRSRFPFVVFSLPISTKLFRLV